MNKWMNNWWISLVNVANKFKHKLGAYRIIAQIWNTLQQNYYGNKTNSSNSFTRNATWSAQCSMFDNSNSKEVKIIKTMFPMNSVETLSCTIRTNEWRFSAAREENSSTFNLKWPACILYYFSRAIALKADTNANIPKACSVENTFCVFNFKWFSFIEWQIKRDIC